MTTTPTNGPRRLAVLAALRAGPRTTAELAAASGCTLKSRGRGSISDILTKMRREGRIVRAGNVRDGRQARPAALHALPPAGPSR